MMRFTEPLYLLLLPILWGWVWWTGRRLLGVSRARRRVILALRMLLILLVVLALAGWQGVQSLRSVCTIFVLDQSASVSDAGRQAARAYLQQAIKNAPDDALTGLVVFGAEPMVEWLPAPRRELGSMYAKPNADGTDIAGALRLASAMFPDGYARRIVLLTDGNETHGDAHAAAQVASVEGIPIDVVPLTTGKAGNDALIEAIEAPSVAKVGEPYNLRIVVQSQRHAEGKITLDREGTPLKTLPVKLSPGVNLITTTLRADKAGVQRVRATLDAQPDIDPRNNLGLALTRVQGKPHVLIAEGRAGASEAIARALQANHISVTRVHEGSFPATSEKLLDYDAIVFNDFPATALSPQQMEAVKNAVRDGGVGFVMIGGNQSYQMGGYYGTPIAEVLPVDLDIKHRQIQHAATVVLIVDASGSMNEHIGPHKVAHLAAEASIKTLQMLRPIDRFGVIISSHGSDWLLPEYARTGFDPFSCDGRRFQGCHGQRAGQPPSAIFPASEREPIIAVLQKVYGTGGGIFVRGSLEMAMRGMLSEPPDRARHIIMLADATDCDEQEGSLERAQQLRAMGVTLSVVAFGDGKDTGFLKKLAQVGGGQFYQTRDAASLPRLFTADVSAMTRSTIEEGAFIPKVNATDERLREVDWSRTPALLAYNLVSDRPLAQVLMRTHKDDPLLAVWRYGLGTVIAFTSDAQPRWAQRWIGWQGYSVFWTQVIRSAMRPSAQPNLGLTATVRNGQAIVELQAFTPQGEPINGLTPQLVVGMPSGEQQQLTMNLEGAGRYVAQFPIREQGLFTLSTQGDFGGGRQATLTAALAVPYPLEYRFYRENRPLLERIAAQTRGRVNPEPARAYDPPPMPQRFTRDLWTLALLLSLMLLMVDITVRRVVITIPEVCAALLGKLRWRRAPRAATVQTTARLQAAKQRAFVARASPPVHDRLGETPKPQPVARASPPVQESVARASPPVQESVAQASPPVQDAPAASQDTLGRLLKAKQRTTKS
ncbi:MAG: glutamine amidotransferase [Fimbriimonadales bacterium]|nr:glutamine amidotransferase [Fimbriimonadales bacterium]